MSRNGLRIAATLLAGGALLIGGCASQPSAPTGGHSKAPASGSGGYYQDDGPPADENIDVDSIPDAVPRNEPPSRYGNPDSYEALGKRYYVMASAAGFTQTGRASWYGKQFHGRRTSSGEPYNMFKMTAAHKRLPIPSYVRVTNLDNGKQAIVRVNDRGPFHDGRIIDLSYVAARRLGVVTQGSAPVRIETVTPASMRAEKSGRQRAPARSARAPSRKTPPQPARNAARSAQTAQPAPHNPRADSPGRAIPVANRSEQPPQRPQTDSGLYLQSGAFGDAGNAERLRRRLDAAGFKNVIIREPGSGTPYYRVQLGPFDNARSRVLARRILVEQGFAAREVER